MERKWESLVAFLSSTILARQNCLTPPFTTIMDGEKDVTEEYWQEMAQTHTTRIRMAEDFLPSGSGFDSGTEVDLDASHADRIILHTSFHHMNQDGYYEGWTDHTITATPSFWNEMHLRISGRNVNEIKDYIAEAMRDALARPVIENEQGLRSE